MTPRALTRDYMQRVLTQAAASAGVTLDDLLAPNSQIAGVADARARAWLRAARETGATPKAIARVSGFDYETVRLALRRIRSELLARNQRMAWLYGADTKTQRNDRMADDIAAWRALGRRGGRAA